MSSRDEGKGRSLERVRVAEDAAAAVAASTLGAIHPALGVLADMFITIRSSGLLSGWLTVADCRLEEAGAVLDASDPRAQASFNRLTLAALQTARTEKWELLATALVRSAQVTADSDFIVDHFAELVIRLSPEHVSILRVFDRPGDFGLDISRLSDAALLAIVAPERSDRDDGEISMIVDVARSELESNDLVGTRFTTSLNRAMKGLYEEGQSDVFVTEKGQRFLAYLGS